MHEGLPAMQVTSVEPLGATRPTSFPVSDSFSVASVKKWNGVLILSDLIHSIASP